MTFVDHGVPVVSSRQWAYTLVPNKDNTDWNFVTSSYNLGTADPVEWVVLKNITGTASAPSQQIYDTPSGFFPNHSFSIGVQQLRALNGRVFFPMYQNYIAYYEPSTESVAYINAFVENPPVNPNASTQPFSAAFDTAGQIYMATDESASRPSCVVHLDPDTLSVTVLGYVGSGALSYTTYGYYIVADTGTSQKYLYIVYGQNPWQLWALNTVTGETTKLYEVPSAGHIAFSEISGQGWVATIDTDLGQPDNVRTQWWCQDGAISAYTVNVASPSPRDVTPAANPLVEPPAIDASGGIGIVGWRPYGSSGSYAYLNYSVTYSSPSTIESLIATSDGVMGNADQYQGFFRYVEPADTHTWFGPATSMISGGQRLGIGGEIYIVGYPNGTLYRYDPAQTWLLGTNPVLVGEYGPDGTQYAGIKDTDAFAWSSGAGSAGRLYCAGRRDRSGTGAGIGYYDLQSDTFAGTYASPLDTVQPKGLVALNGPGRVALSTTLLNPPGSAPLYVFDQALNLVSTQTPLSGVATLGPLFATQDQNVICGIVQGSGNSLGMYQHDVVAGTLVKYVEAPIIGTIGTTTTRSDGSVWLISGNNLVRVDVNTLTANVIADLTTITPVAVMTFGSDNRTIYFAGGTSGAEVWSTDVGALTTIGAIGRGSIRGIAGRGGTRSNQGRATIRS